MIITRSPYRISFFGGGSDYSSWFEAHTGAVLATAIDKYCFITYRRLPPFFNHKNRIVYSSVEHTGDLDDIKHPGVRETLKFTGVNGIEIHHDGDLPARSGTGSSSAFVVGLLNAIYTAVGRRTTPRDLAMNAYHVEKNLAGEAVGLQDQILAAHGGFRHVRFNRDGYELLDHGIDVIRVNKLLEHVTLLYTGQTRDSSPLAASYISNMKDREAEMRRTYEMVEEAIDVIKHGRLADIGTLLHESWELKKRRGAGISTPRIDDLYDAARRAGATGGKVIGAGGAGFMILFSDPADRERLQWTMKSTKGCLSIPFQYENSGSVVVYSDGN